jgi:hypothetical protein
MSTLTAIAINTDSIEAAAVRAAIVLREEKIFGNIDDSVWLDMEQDAFTRSVVIYAKEGAPYGYLELTYRSSNTRLIISVSIKENEAVLDGIIACDHPFESDAIDYEALSAKLEQAAGIVK